MIILAHARALFYASEWALFLNAAKEIKSSKILEAIVEKEISELEEQAHFHLKEFSASLEIIDQLIAQYPSQYGYTIRKAYILAVTRQFSHALAVLNQMLSKQNIPPAIRSDSFLLMKNIEIENWKTLISLLILDPAFVNTLTLNLQEALENKKILLPEEEIIILMQAIKKQDNPFEGINFSDGTPN